MKKFICILIPIIMFSFSCKKEKIDLQKEKEAVKKTDIEFSNMSEKEGMFKAFLNYADDEAVLLRNNSMSIISKEKIGKNYTGRSDSGFILTWKPMNVFISESADLAYTFGTYTLDVKNDTLQTDGTYLTIWKKQDAGAWKWVLDTGNEGLGK